MFHDGIDVTGLTVIEEEKVCWRRSDREDRTYKVHQRRFVEEEKICRRSPAEERRMSVGKCPTKKEGPLKKV